MRKLIALPLILVLLLTACAPDSIALLDAIVTAAEVILPSIPGLAPQDANAINVYINAALTITNDLLVNGTSPASIAKAVRDFTALALPQLSQPCSSTLKAPCVPPSVIVLIQAVANSITAFLNAYKGATPQLTAVGVAATPPLIVKLSAKDAKKIEAIRVRIVRDKATLTRR